MANVKLPFKDFAAFIEKVVLDGVPYQLRFRWNTVGEYWTLQISSIAGTIILAGIKIVLNYELIRDFRWLGGPPGELYAIDTTGELSTISRDALPDGTVYLRYVPEADL
jgi:hypothetical protein